MQTDDQFRGGDPYVLCQRSGQKVRKSKTVIEPRTGLRVLATWADPIHPQDHIRSKRDQQTFRRSIPEPEDRFLALNEITEASF